jgi:hypothetical protein
MNNNYASIPPCRGQVGSPACSLLTREERRCLTTAPTKAPHQGGDHGVYPEQCEEDGQSNTQAERDRPFFYLAAAYGPQGIKYAVKKDRGEELYEGSMPNRYRIRRLWVFV